MAEWLTIKEAAEHLKVGVPTIRKYIKLGKIQYYQEGRILRFIKEDLDNFLKPKLQGK